ncbi:Spy/CpxP family protein refolding chaperone [Spirulina sp. CCNP1310]|uniref:Spy/CpxP family protein refolding chaperone n=1 Tax=Spirulina sp. CCNP1310 TaxID=3110249 RepID=UPI002B20CF0A|nr:Spy/CpxP family protein refolding chaperone [Spirulina sp. CCNP1310]MEA5419429.1 Spy/CpxP family protein refolding chaperone [Spirulina sp. CCNP1310]
MKRYALTLLTITTVAAPLAAWMLFTPPMPEANAVPVEVAQAGPPGQPGMGPMGEPGERLLRMADQLGLSDAQRSQIQNIFAEAKTANEPLLQEMEAAREQMHTLMTSGASQAELQAQHDRMQALRQQMGDRHFSTMMAVHEVLTPEQQAKLQEMHSQRGQMGGMGRGPGNRPGNGDGTGQGPSNRPNARPMNR